VSRCLFGASDGTSIGFFGICGPIGGQEVGPELASGGTKSANIHAICAVFGLFFGRPSLDIFFKIAQLVRMMVMMVDHAMSDE